MAFTVIGGTRVLWQNSDLLALGNIKLEEDIEQTFTVYDVVGALIAGVLLTFARQYFMPSAILTLTLALQTFAYAIMIDKDMMKDHLIHGIKLNAICEGSLFTTLTVFVHEEYGTEQLALALGSIISFGAFGLFVLEEFVIQNLMSEF